MTLVEVDVESPAFRYALLQVAAGQFGQAYGTLTEDKRKTVENIALKQCALQSQVLGSPESAQVVVLSEQIDQEVDGIIARYPSSEAFIHELESNDLDPAGFQQLVERNLRVDAVMDYVASDIEPCSDLSARLYYYMNTDKFRQPELREASHILITVNPEFPENSRDAVIERAGAIAERLQNKPMRFAEQALKHSECPTAMNGGTLGTLKRGVLFPELDEVLFAMKAGEVSHIVETPLGFHILKCESVHKAGFIPIAKVLPKIKEKLEERDRKNRLRSWLKALARNR
ncbi:MAG TPA: nitrogen fixation protein NifM [Gammaproteobacteria bacterium]|jgi:nitrogen fixation protein NifM|nr:nitrogen fixation protein NifM [Gammaproteobacteria bacterium]